MRKSQQIVSVLFLFGSISLFMSSRLWAVEAASTSRSTWESLPSANEKMLVQVRVAGGLVAEPEWTYIVCHGMWGTTAGDRFERLCAAIKRQLPQCNVVLLDWSDASKSGGGLFMAWRVSKNIDPVADQAAKQLQALPLDRTRTTLIGESFGNYVNARLAKHLGGCERILAFNPASELGGYPPSDLQAAARTAWSFHTWSVYDTSRPIAHRELLLETPTDASELAQHMHGITWLSERLEAGDQSWLSAEQQIPECKHGCYPAVAGLDGELILIEVPRQRPD
jgi:pimeloyl-ACP methyl ester carboxylesterase